MILSVVLARSDYPFLSADMARSHPIGSIVCLGSLPHFGSIQELGSLLEFDSIAPDGSLSHFDSIIKLGSLNIRIHVDLASWLTRTF
jgi:hypothetical protein